MHGQLRQTQLKSISLIASLSCGGSDDPIIINWIYWTRLYEDFRYPGKIRFLGSYKECQEEYSKLHDEYRKKYERLYQNPICYKNIN